jgi:hypothetical protein
MAGREPSDDQKTNRRLSRGDLRRGGSVLCPSREPSPSSFAPPWPAAVPPPVTVIAQLSLDAGGSGTGYGSSPAGTLGVACFTGTQEAPTLTLAGPFPIGL